MPKGRKFYLIGQRGKQKWTKTVKPHVFGATWLFLLKSFLDQPVSKHQEEPIDPLPEAEKATCWGPVLGPVNQRGMPQGG